MLGLPSFSLPRGPQIGQPTNTLDIDPYLDKSCATFASGTTCKPTTAEGVDLFRAVQISINQAAAALKLIHKPLKTDGLIGPETAELAIKVLYATPLKEGRIKVWLQDPRSTQISPMAQLLSAQPQFAAETFEEIAAAAGSVIAPQPVGPGLTPTAPAAGSPAPGTVVPSVSAQAQPPTPGTQPAPQPLPQPLPAPAPVPTPFWTRRKKVLAIVGASVLVVGVTGLVIWMRHRGG